MRANEMRQKKERGAIAEKMAIPSNRNTNTSSSMPNVVREFAELLADIAMQQLRRTEHNSSTGEEHND